MKSKEEKFKLVIPSMVYKEKAIKYIEEHNEYKSAINGDGMLHYYLNDYEGWLEVLERERNIVADENQVPTETFFLVRANDDKIIGMVNIRLKLNERVRNSYGSIGYGIRPTERRKGYNKINLYLTLLKCKEMGIRDVILSCKKDNIGSSKTMLALGANFNREVYNETSKELIQFYTINVNDAVEQYKNQY